jgi:hypothetical protein
MKTSLFVCLFVGVTVELSWCAIVYRDTTSFRRDGIGSYTEPRNIYNKSSGLSPVQLQPGTKKKLTTPNDVITSVQNLIQGDNKIEPGELGFNCVVTV